MRWLGIPGRWDVPGWLETPRRGGTPENQVIQSFISMVS